MYDTVEEIRQKLEGGVILHDSKPYWVIGATGRRPKFNIRLADPKDNEKITDVAFDDAKLDIWSLGTRLGYINYDNENIKQAVYTLRIPVRNTHATQGLCERNVEIKRLMAYKKKRLAAGNISFQSLVRSDGFAKAMKRSYPTFDKAVATLEKDDYVYSVAFHPTLALRRSNYSGMFLLDYKGTEVGLSEDLAKWRISSEYKYLDNLLEKCNLKVA